MTITYRTSGAWGSGKGSNLTAAEVDGNFYDLDGRVTDLEDNPPVPAEISNIAVSGSQVTFYLSNGSSYGPYTLPRSRFSWRGYWAASTAYVGNDLVRVRGLGVYLCLEPHTSTGSFDPDATTGSAEPIWAQMMGEVAEVKTGAVDSAGNYDPQRTDAGKYIRINDASPVSIDMNDAEYDVLSVGVEIHYRQGGAGQLSFLEGSATTINVPAGYAATTAYQGALVTLKKVSAGVWDIFGALEIASTAT